jgi:hypothetical protein
MTRLDLSYVGRPRVVSPEPEIITLLDETMVIEPQDELTTIFVDDRTLAGPTFPNCEAETERRARSPPFFPNRYGPHWLKAHRAVSICAPA